MPKVLRIAVIGAGTMAQAVHLPVLRRRWDRFSVEALVDHSPRRRREAAEAWGIAEDARYESVADLVTAVRAKTLGLDAVVLATDGLHVEDVLSIVRRGIPVLVEPPIAFSEGELRRLADFERMTGRRLVVLAYPQQHDDAVAAMAGHIARKDLRMIDYEVLMPASQPLFGHAHVTSSAYDLPSEVRSQRRTALQEAVVAGTGEAATQRDRDLYVKGLLTGVSHQLAVLQKAYGPLTEILAVRHWPRGVIPGSIEILGELESGAPVRLVWHYLPFAPEYSERLRLLSARRRVEVDLAPPSFADRRSSITLREKSSGAVTATTVTSQLGSAEAMWEDFHAFVTKGEDPGSGVPEALAELGLLHEILDRIVTADGRSLEPEAEAEPEPEGAAERTAEDDRAADDPTASQQPIAGSGTSTAAAERDVTVDAPPADSPGSQELGGADEIAAAQAPADDPARGAPALAEPAASPASSEQITEVLPDVAQPPARTAALPVAEAEGRPPALATDAESALEADGAATSTADAAPPDGPARSEDPAPSEDPGPRAGEDSSSEAVVPPVDPARAVDDVNAWNMVLRERPEPAEVRPVPSAGATHPDPAEATGSEPADRSGPEPADLSDPGSADATDPAGGDADRR